MTIQIEAPEYTDPARDEVRTRGEGIAEVASVFLAEGVKTGNIRARANRGEPYMADLADAMQGRDLR